jgi:two-component system response regulator AlgR
MTERTVLVVDDEAPARERLERLVGELPGWCVVECCGTGQDALGAVARVSPDVVLLDIRMPGMNGIETARHLSALESPPAVIFTTAYDEHALEAFEARAIGYLLKPVRRERLEEALRHAARLASPALASLGAEDALFEPREHIAVRVRDELKLIPVKNVLYFRAEQKYVTVRHAAGEELIEEPLKALEEEFRNAFVRIHRSVLVAVAHTAALEKSDSGSYCVKLRGIDEALPVSRRQLGDLKSRLNARRRTGPHGL